MAACGWAQVEIGTYCENAVINKLYCDTVDATTISSERTFNKVMASCLYFKCSKNYDFTSNLITTMFILDTFGVINLIEDIFAIAEPIADVCAIIALPCNPE